MTPTTPAALTIARFDPALHDLASFRCGVAEVDSFFRPHRDEHNFRFVWEQRVGDMFVALADGRLVGVVAYAASSLSRAADVLVVDEFRKAGRKGRRKPLEQGRIPAVRIIILGVRRDSQRMGVGSALIRHALDAVTAPVYYLVPQRNSEAFYEKAGFVEKSAGIQKLMMRIPPARDFRPSSGK